MKIVFTDQYANIFFLVNGLIILFYLGAKKKKKQRAMKFGNYETLQKVAGKNFLKSSNILLLMKLATITLLIIGISSPVLVQEVQSTESDYVIALDSSSSMLAADLEPTRFKAAKDISQQFIGQISNDTEVGLVSFAGEVNKEKELTNEKSNLRTALANAEIGTTAGTAIGDAVYSSTSMLLNTDESRTVVVITDGRNNVGSSINDSISFANSHNVTVNAIGIGDANRSTDNFGTVEGQNASRPDYPNLNTAELNRLANQTGGQLMTVTNSSALQSAFLEMEKSEQRTDLSWYFIMAALVLMITEWTLGTTKYSILP